MSVYSADNNDSCPFKYFLNLMIKCTVKPKIKGVFDHRLCGKQQVLQPITVLLLPSYHKKVVVMSSTKEMKLKLFIKAYIQYQIGQQHKV